MHESGRGNTTRDSRPHQRQQEAGATDGCTRTYAEVVFPAQLGCTTHHATPRHTRRHHTATPHHDGTPTQSDGVIPDTHAAPCIHERYSLRMTLLAQQHTGDAASTQHRALLLLLSAGPLPRTRIVRVSTPAHAPAANAHTTRCNRCMATSVVSCTAAPSTRARRSPARHGFTSGRTDGGGYVAGDAAEAATHFTQRAPVVATAVQRVDEGHGRLRRRNQLALHGQLFWDTCRSTSAIAPRRRPSRRPSQSSTLHGGSTVCVHVAAVSVSPTRVSLSSRSLLLVERCDAPLAVVICQARCYRCCCCACAAAL
jgi:hypothetical protein